MSALSEEAATRLHISTGSGNAFYQMKLLRDFEIRPDRLLVDLFVAVEVQFGVCRCFGTKLLTLGLWKLQASTLTCISKPKRMQALVNASLFSITEIA